MNRRLIHSLLVVSWVSALDISTAAAAPRDPGSLKTLMHLRTEIVILKQELKIAQLRAQIQKTHGAGGLQRPGEDTSPSDRGMPVALPRIRSITGHGLRVEARLENTDGSRQTVRVGSVLPDGARIARITSRAVWVTWGHHTAASLPWVARSRPQGAAPMAGSGLSPTANLRSLLMGTIPSTPTPSVARPAPTPPTGSPAPIAGSPPTPGGL